MCTCVCECSEKCGGAYVGTRVWRPEANIGHLPGWLSTSYVAAGLSLRFRARLASQSSGPVCLRDPVSTSHTLGGGGGQLPRRPSFYMGSGDQNAGPHAHAAPFCVYAQRSWVSGQYLLWKVYCRDSRGYISECHSLPCTAMLCSNGAVSNSSSQGHSAVPPRVWGKGEQEGNGAGMGLRCRLAKEHSSVTIKKHFCQAENLGFISTLPVRPCQGSKHASSVSGPPPPKASRAPTC